MKKIEIEIPIYRAKKIDSDEYVEGFYAYDECHKRHLIITNNIHGLCETIIDQTTLSIHFNDMTDSQGNKIFASLSEDGKGGDIFILNDERLKYIAMITRNQLMAKQQGTYGSFIGQGYAETNKWKVIGIQE